MSTYLLRKLVRPTSMLRTLSLKKLPLHRTKNISQFSRQINGSTFSCSCIHDVTQPCGASLQKHRSYSWFSNPGIGLQNAIKEAETLVGYTTTFNSWKYLFDEEPATFIGLARKIVGSGHPLLQTARDMLSQDPHRSSHLGGLWVLLVSKAAGVNHNFDTGANVVQGIHEKQRLLAETTELINTAFMIHRNMVDLTDDTYKVEEKKTLEFGNKLFILGGDFLLSKASLELAKIENTDVVGLMGESIGDMSEGGTMEIDARDVSEWTMKTWQDYIFLVKGTLMANSCKASAKIVQHGDTLEGKAFDFGKNLVLAQFCGDDINSFLSKKQLLKKTNFVVVSSISRPEVSNFIRNNADVWTSAETNGRLKTLIVELQPDIIAECKHACQWFIDACFENISDFPEQDTVKMIKSILQNISVLES